MKKLWFLAAFLLWASAGQAAESKEFVFLGDLVDSLRYCRVSLDYRITGKTPLQKMISDVEEADLNLERARRLLEKYLKEESVPAIGRCAASVVNAIDMIGYSLDGFRGKLSSVGGLHPAGFEDSVPETARFRAQNKKGWEELCASLRETLAPVVDKISEDERQQLSARINEWFKEGVPEGLWDVPGDQVLKEEKREIAEEFSDALAFFKEQLGHE
jgi:hypothetical protein